LEREKDKDTVGYLPKLSRILEEKESKNSRRQRNYTVSSAEDHTPAFRRHYPVEDATLGRQPISQKHGSLQRRAENLTSLPNPSLISILSGTTQLSSTSNESNSTITQQSYNKTHNVYKRRSMKQRKQSQAKSVSPKAETMDSQQSAVFQYMNEGLVSEKLLVDNNHDERPSTSSSTLSSATSSSHDTEHDDGQSSDEDEPLEDESPMTSPASTRRPDHDEEDSYRDKFNSESGISVSECSTESVHRASGHYQIEEEDEEEEEEEDDDEEEEEEQEEEDESESDSEEEGGAAYSADDHVDKAGHTHHLTMERVPPPRIPSSSSPRHSDTHTRRMRSQERVLRDHMLQSPQPHRDFQYVGGPSPAPPAIPAFDPYSYNSVPPNDYYAQAPQHPGWPPQAPPPVAIGYYSPPQAPYAPYTSGAEQNSTMSPQYHMAAPNAAVPPPWQHALQPPHYQSQPIGPNLSKTAVIGYELLADKLTELSKSKHDIHGEDVVVPMYRKFEQLNHRILLHLQDEISELEEELRDLDGSIAQSSPRGEAGHVHPASRRGDARFGGELHHKRTDLLGRIYLKLGQYSKILNTHPICLARLPWKKVR
jgi:hypothetical protein